MDKKKIAYYEEQFRGYIAMFLVYEYGKQLGTLIDPFYKKDAITNLESLYTNLQSPMSMFKDGASDCFDRFIEKELDYSYMDIYAALFSVFVFYFRTVKPPVKVDKQAYNKFKDSFISYNIDLPKSVDHALIIAKINKFLVNDFHLIIEK